MVQKTNAVLLIIALLFIGGCGERLTDYQTEIIEKAEGIIASEDVSELSAREVYVLLGLLYTERVKLEEYKEVGSNYDKLYTAFSNLIPTYQNLAAREVKEAESLNVDMLVKTAKLIAADDKAGMEEHQKKLEANIQDLEKNMGELIATEQELFKSLLRVTTETQENPIWAENKAKDYMREFGKLVEAEEKVGE